jgi:hypothetical protein
MTTCDIGLRPFSLTSVRSDEGPDDGSNAHEREGRLVSTFPLVSSLVGLNWCSWPVVSPTGPCSLVEDEGLGL